MAWLKPKKILDPSYGQPADPWQPPQPGFTGGPGQQFNFNNNSFGTPVDQNQGQQQGTQQPQNQPSGETLAPRTVNAPTAPAAATLTLDPMTLQAQAPMATPIVAATPTNVPGTQSNDQFQTPATGQATQGQTRDLLFQNVSPDIQKGYTSTLSDMLTGKIYDPFAAGQKEAESRREANERAKAAGQIASAGFSGTGIGQSVASGLEGELAQNRFATNISIEQARNAARMQGLGEARAYGTAEQQQAQQMLDNAALYGSAQDVAAAFKQATGQDLNPEQAQMMIDQKRVQLQTSQQNLATLRRTDSGTALAGYIQNHPNSINNPSALLGDQAFMNAAQAAWTANGGQGQVPTDWALQQVQAVNTAGNPAIMANMGIDQAVQAGVLTPDQAKVMKSLPYSVYSRNNWTVNQDGSVTPNLENLEKSLGLPAGTLSGGGSTYTTPSGLKINLPTTGQGSQNQQIFTGSDGNIYRNDSGEIVPVPANDVTFDDLKGLSTADPAYQAAFKATNEMSTGDMQKNFDTLVSSGELLKVKGQLVKAKGTYSKKVSEMSDSQKAGLGLSLLGPIGAAAGALFSKDKKITVMVFETPDGKQIEMATS